LLTELSAKTGLSPSGKDFLIAALDPMHDSQLQNLMGWPDVESAPSIVRCVKQSLPIVMPTGLSTTTWDCYINTWPYLDALPQIQSSRNNNLLGATTDTAAPFTSGGVSVFAVSGGGTCTPGASGSPQVGNLSLDSSYTQGTGRLIGMGLEVVNTTSDLNKQGLCTVYRVPQPHTDPATFSGTLLDIVTGFNSAANTMLSGELSRMPPTNVADAMLYSGSRQWKASDGSYQVVSFIGQDNPPKNVSYDQPLLSLTDDIVGRNANTAVPTYLPGAYVSAASAQAILPGVKLTPTHMSGVIFSGLSTTTTLNLNVNMYYETFPSISEKSILVLAKPSCNYDPVALEFLSRTLNVLPVGVPAYMNGFGDWFADIVDTLANFAAPIGMLLGGPAGAALGATIGNVGRAVSKVTRTNYPAPPAGPQVFSKPIPTMASQARKQAPIPPRRTSSLRPMPPARTSSRKKKKKTVL
jgi:hypothetical protein